MNTENEFVPVARKLAIFLADDDKADCVLFKQALEELPVVAQLTVFQNGEQLMKHLTKKQHTLPDVLFLDLNMPRKNGFATLGEIKRNNQLDRLPVIIFSTVSKPDNVNQVFRDAAHYYIRKPNEFSELKKVIYQVLALVGQGNIALPVKEDFMLTGDVKAITNETKPAAKKSPRKAN